MTSGPTTSPLLDPGRRHDFVLLFDVIDGNPNGDPDSGNLPRVDPETMQGLVTDVCLKRKVRDWVQAAYGDRPGMEMYVRHRTFLYEQQRRAYRTHDGKDERHIADARKWMCSTFYDVRLFGAVMATKEYNCGQVRGPLQLTFARSIDPISPLDLAITRTAPLKPGEPTEAAPEAPAYGTMARKVVVPYALYRCHGFFSPPFARDTGASPEDLRVFWEALQRMWDLDRSARKGLLAFRGLWVFTHESPLGNAQAHALFERVSIQLREGVITPRRFADYVVDVNVGQPPVPANVTLTTIG